MGLFAKPLLPARYENEDVQINPALFPNIAIHVVGLARVGSFTSPPSTLSSLNFTILLTSKLDSDHSFVQQFIKHRTLPACLYCTTCGDKTAVFAFLSIIRLSPNTLSHHGPSRSPTGSIAQRGADAVCTQLSHTVTHKLSLSLSLSLSVYYV